MHYCCRISWDDPRTHLVVKGYRTLTAFPEKFANNRVKSCCRYLRSISKNCRRGKLPSISSGMCSTWYEFIGWNNGPRFEAVYVSMTLINFDLVTIIFNDILWITVLLLCSFGLFAAVSCLMKNDLAPYLEGMVKQMVETLNSTEGITVSVASSAYGLQLIV